MNDSSCALARTTAHMLRACAPQAWLNLTLFVLGIWPLAPLPHALPVLLIAQLLAPTMLIACAYFLHWRIALDAKLLMDFAQQTLRPSQLDESLTQLQLRRPATTERAMTERCTSSLRLCKCLWLISALQCIWLVFHIWQLH